MNTERARRVVVWVLGPLAVAAAAAVAGRMQVERERGALYLRTVSVSPAARKKLEAALPAAIAKLTWSFGNPEAVKAMVHEELGRLPDSDGPERARWFLRMSVVDDNPDGQAAVFSAACNADPNVCGHLKEAVERELRTRYVWPNYLPMPLVPEHSAGRP